MSQLQILNKRLTLERPDDGFSVGIDGILMAAACPAQAGESVLDLGCGIGTAGLCVAARVDGIALTSVEILEREAGLAQENAAANGVEASVICADIRNFESDRFDHVICNPPYLKGGAYLKSPDPARAGAMGHGDTTLEDWIKAAHRNLKSKGSLTMVHRADMLDEIIRGLGRMFGAVEIIPLWPKAGVEAKRVIVRALKDRHNPTRLHAGLVLHQNNGDYTAVADAVLRDGEAL